MAETIIYLIQRAFSPAQADNVSQKTRNFREFHYLENQTYWEHGIKWTRMGETSSSRACMHTTPLFVMTQICWGKKEKKKTLAKVKSESASERWNRIDRHAAGRAS